MKDFLSKEYHCYKIHTLLMKSTAYPSSIENPLYGLPHFYKEILRKLCSGKYCQVYSILQEHKLLHVKEGKKYVLKKKDI